MKKPLADILASSRIVSARDAVVAAFSARLDVPVYRHIGKLDVSDVLDGDVYAAPSIHIAVSRMTPADVATGDQDLVLHFAAYIVAQEAMIDGKRFERDEIGYALALEILSALNDEDFARWELDFISPPEAQDASPIFTSKNFAQGLAYYAATWRQTLYADASACAQPWSDPL